MKFPSQSSTPTSTTGPAITSAVGALAAGCGLLGMALAVYAPIYGPRYYEVESETSGTSFWDREAWNK
jgi:hypothetical protein